MTAPRRALLALALYRLAEFGPWVAILVYAYREGGAVATGLVSFGLLVPTAACSPLGGPSSGEPLAEARSLALGIP